MPYYPPLLLASRSPRRAKLLRQAGIPFDVCSVEVSESIPDTDPDPAQWTRALALRKARAIQLQYPQRIILAADTIVLLNGEILGKPEDEEAAVEMLTKLSGRGHVVITGFAIIDGISGKQVSECVRTSVRFQTMQHEWIRAYVATGEPLDKAGAYGIQGKAGVWIAEINGCYNNVVGLPLAEVCKQLRCFGINPEAFWT